MRRLSTCVLLAFFLYGCGDECSSYSNYSCKQIEDATYEVYFYFPDDHEKPLGRVTGLQSCSSTANAYAAQTGAPKRWICCMVTSTSSCEEKHR